MGVMGRGVEGKSRGVGDINFKIEEKRQKISFYLPSWFHRNATINQKCT